MVGTDYVVDALGNLRSVTVPDGRVITYVVDGVGRRVGKKVDGSLVQGLLYRGPLQPVAQLNAAGGVSARFVYASGRNVPDYAVRGNTLYRIITDHLGSLRLVVDTNTGAIMQRMDYDAWGKVTRDDAASGWEPFVFGFAGGIYDRDTGLVRFGARDYDSSVGRWISKDPILFGGGDANIYAYVGGDPVNRIDPSGLDPIPDDVQYLLAPYFPTLDLSGVQVHPDYFVGTKDSKIGAYTRGQDIYFRVGVYDPLSSTGISRIAHELVHVLQYQQFDGPWWLRMAAGSEFLRRHGDETRRHGSGRDNVYEFYAYEMGDRVKRDLDFADANSCRE